MDERACAGAACDALLWADLLRSRAAGAVGTEQTDAVDDRTLRDVSVDDPDVALVVNLAHCACVSKAWRAAVLRRLVRVLSPPFKPWSRAAAASAITAYSAEREALALIESNGIAPLFVLAQAAPRRQDLTPEPSVHPATLAMADNGIQALAMLAGVAERQLAAADWSLLDPDEVRKERGGAATELSADVGPVYEHNKTMQLTRQNPLLGSGNDAADLLQELPSLLSPQWMPKEKRVRWPATIRHHCVADSFCPPVDEDLTVVDEFVAAPPGDAPGASDGAPEELRQLVLGAWAGLTGFRETEWNLAEAPGENLYAWYTTALAAVVSLRIGTQAHSRRRPRLLLIGLGGGSLATFFGHYYGQSVEMDVVERSGPVVHAAENFFGLRDHEREADATKTEDKAEARSQEGELANGTRVQVEGLQKATVHNGKSGTISAWVAARGRYAVTLDKGGKTIHVKQENLRQLGAAAVKKTSEAAEKGKEAGGGDTEGGDDAWDVFSSGSDDDDDDGDGDGGKDKADEDAWGVFGSDSDDDDDNDDGMEVDQDAAKQEEAEEEEEEEEAEPASRMTVHVEDALRFARRSAAALSAAEDGTGRYYDAILLDVYTQEHFPSELLSEQFFQDLRCMLRRGSGEGKGGEEETAAGFIAVNVGGARAEGGGFDTVLQRLSGLSLESGEGSTGTAAPALRRVDVLLEDDTEPSQNDDDADPEEDLGTANAVLVGWGGGAMPPALSADDWAASTTVGNSLAVKAGGHVLPYRLGTCISEVFVPPPPPAAAAAPPPSSLAMSGAQLEEFKRLLRPGVDDAAASLIADAEAEAERKRQKLEQSTRLSHVQLGELKALLEPGRDDAAVQFLEDAEAAEAAVRSQSERLAKLQRVAAEAPVTAPQVVAAAAAQSVVVHRVSFQEAESADLPADGSGARGAGGAASTQRQAATMAVGDAQKTAVLRVPGFLSAEEVAEVHQAAEAFIAEKAAATAAAAAAAAGPVSTDKAIAAGSSSAAAPLAPARSSPTWETGRKWNVSFLHNGGMFESKLPAIRGKILELGRRVDRENWGQIAASGLEEGDLAIRFVEYHRMVEGAGLANPKHYVSLSRLAVLPQGPLAAAGCCCCWMLAISCF